MITVSLRSTGRRKRVLQALMEKHQPEGGHVKITAGDPLYRFGDPSSIDPTSQTEDLGDDG